MDYFYIYVMNNKERTLICVAIAGTLFIAAVIFDLWYLALIAAVFDWLPLPTGWMKFSDKPQKNIIILHIALTLIAYAFLIIWLIRGGIYGFVFLEFWWSAVIAGFFI